MTNEIIQSILNQKSPETAVFHHKALLITVNKTFKSWSLYDATRYAWKIDSKKASDADVVLATMKGFIVAAFLVDGWLEATEANFPGRAESGGAPGRFGFVGREAPAHMLDLYVGKRVPDSYRKWGAANPIRYTW
jgi:hypothetical protein